MRRWPPLTRRVGVGFGASIGVPTRELIELDLEWVGMDDCLRSSRLCNIESASSDFVPALFLRKS